MKILIHIDNSHYFANPLGRTQVFKEETLNQVIVSTQTYVFSGGIDILAAIITMFMIYKLSSDENFLSNNLNDAQH